MGSWMAGGGGGWSKSCKMRGGSEGCSVFSLDFVSTSKRILQSSKRGRKAPFYKWTWGHARKLEAQKCNSRHKTKCLFIMTIFIDHKNRGVGGGREACRVNYKELKVVHGLQVIYFFLFVLHSFMIGFRNMKRKC